MSDELSPAESAALCAGCQRCCRYIAVQIDTPRAAWEYDQWVWALDHEGISLYVERPEAWFLHVETRCRHLAGDGRCAIHGRHPVLCREYDARTCERRLPLADIVAWFHSGADLAEWLRKRRPGHHRRLLAFRGHHPPRVARPASGAWVPLEALDLAGSAAARTGARLPGGAPAIGAGRAPRRTS